jgi:hypothetical protein
VSPTTARKLFSTQVMHLREEQVRLAPPSTYEVLSDLCSGMARIDQAPRCGPRVVEGSSPVSGRKSEFEMKAIACRSDLDEGNKPLITMTFETRSSTEMAFVLRSLAYLGAHETSHGVDRPEMEVTVRASDRLEATEYVSRRLAIATGQ